MDPAMIHSYWTVLLLVAFVAIVIWAFSGKRSKAFEEAANVPLEEDNVTSSQENFRG